MNRIPSLFLGLALGMAKAGCEHGLDAGYLLLPWSRWKAGAVRVTTRVGQAGLSVDHGELQMVAAQATLENRSQSRQSLALYVAVRPLGAAGGPIRSLAAAGQDVLMIDGQPALISAQPASAAGVLERDEIAPLAGQGKMASLAEAQSPSGDCSGALKFELRLEPGQAKTLSFLCPVHPGRKVNGHKWDGVSAWAQLDLQPPYSDTGQYQQPAPGLEFYRDRSRCSAESVLLKARTYWRSITHRVELALPDQQWADAFRTILSHCAMNINEGAPDVAVVNYNVFNRDGMYIANIFQKSGNFELAEAAIEYFLKHPFNGRVLYLVREADLTAAVQAFATPRELACAPCQRSAGATALCHGAVDKGPLGGRNSALLRLWLGAPARAKGPSFARRHEGGSGRPWPSARSVMVPDNNT